MDQLEQTGQSSKLKKEVVFLSRFIRLFSVLYVVAASLPLFGFVAGLLRLEIVTFFGVASGMFSFGFFLPGTFFGIPIVIDFAYGSQYEWAIYPLLGVAFVLGVITYRAGIEIRNLRKRGLVLYTAIVGLLTLGMIIDALFREGEFINPLGALLQLHAAAALNALVIGVWILFILSVVMLWYRFKKLGLLNK